MKLIRKSILALAIAALPLAGGITAQNLGKANFSFTKPANVEQNAKSADNNDENLITLGWCKTGWGQTMQVQRDANDTYAHQVHVAAYFPKEVLKKYVGDQIKYVDFAVEPKRGYRVMVFVADDIKNESFLATGFTSEWDTDWNRCALDEPLTITGDKGLYIGYEVYIGENESMNTITYDNTLIGVKGRNFYGADGQWFELPVNQVPGNFRVRGIISGDNQPDCDAAVEQLISADDYIEQNKGLWKPTLRVRNYGTSSITSLHVQATVNGKVVSEADSEDDFEVEPGEVGDVELKGFTFPEQGTSNVTVTITKVNGKDDPNMDDNSISHTVFCYADGAESYKHNVLVEQFTAEYYKESAMVDPIYKEALDDRSDVVWVKHHMAWLGVPDVYTAEGEDTYLSLFGASDQFLPAVCADRRIFVGQDEPGPAYFIAYAEDLTGMVNGAKSVPTFAKLDIDVNKAADGKSLNVTVDGKSSTAQLQEQTDLRLTVWLVEDGIVSTTQNGQDAYVQDGVLRKIVSEPWGDKVDLSTLAFSRSYNIALDDKWNIDNTRVVAFLSNYNTDVKKCGVYNSAQANVGNGTAISTPSTEKAPVVDYSDGKVVVAGAGYTVAGVYDMAGRRVANNNLTPGLYVVKVAGTYGESTQKLYVRK